MSAIWFKKDITKDDLQFIFQKNLLLTLNIQINQIGDDFLIFEMPVHEKHTQPYGLLHGGASCVLAESIGSIASHMLFDPEKFLTFGLEINATHLRHVEMNDSVIATCSPVKLGSMINVWNIDIKRKSDDKLCCQSRLTTITKPKS